MFAHKTRSVHSSSEDRQALLARILNSPQFARSVRLREFLTFVVERGLSNPDAPIPEAVIAEMVFGRKDGPAGDDSIVRVHASQLRKRLEQYFQTDGEREEVILEVPKGQYTPVFRPRESAPVAETVDRPPSAPWALIASVGGVLLILILALGWDDLRLRTSANASVSPNVSRFWAAFSDSTIPVDIVLADSSLAMVQDMADTNINLEEYANKEYQHLVESVPDSAQRAVASKVMHRRYTSIVDADLSRKISMLPSLRSDRLSIVHARDFQPIHMRTDHVILLGSTRANPWVELLESQLDFQYTFEGKPAKTVIHNRKPGNGEQSVYAAQTDTAGGVPVGYCVVARIPNLGGRGKALIIAGTETEATGAGGEFLLSETSMTQLAQALSAGSSGPLPDFEVLLRTSRVGGSSPTTRILSVHRHP